MNGKGNMVYIHNVIFSSVQLSSVTQACLTLCDPMDHTGLPVHHQLPEFTQTHVHWVSDAIQPSHPLLSPSPPAPNPSQHQGLFQWFSFSHQVDKVLESCMYGDTDVKNRLLDSVGGKGGMIWENSIETYTLPYVKQMTSASSMHEQGTQNWCSESTHRDGVEEFRMMAVDIWQKPSQYCK